MIEYPLRRLFFGITRDLAKMSIKLDRVFEGGVMKRVVFFFLLLISPAVFSSCGYTTRSALPAHLKKVHVENFPNKINFTTKQTRNVYLPLLEVKVRNAVVDRFLFDGNLLIGGPDASDLILQGELVAYQRTGLRFTDDDDIEEYRVEIFMNLSLIDTSTGEQIWEEKNFAGNATYFVTGAQATSESAAADEAAVDLARRIVERTVENW